MPVTPGNPPNSTCWRWRASGGGWAMHDATGKGEAGCIWGTST